MSMMLDVGCKNFAETALTENDFNDRINISQKNMAALIFGYTSIEAFINEVISISEVSNKLSKPKEYFDSIIELGKKLSIKDKYNLLAILLDVELWDSSSEPFQSFEIIQTIRNEVIHHKGNWHEHGGIPIKKLKPVFDKFKLKSLSTSWQSELFLCNDFGAWIYEKSNAMRKQIHEKILRKIEE